MSATMTAFGLDRLSPDERAALAYELWDSLGDDHPPAALTAAQRAELARRDAELDASPGLALTWQQIRSAVEGRR